MNGAIKKFAEFHQRASNLFCKKSCSLEVDNSSDSCDLVDEVSSDLSSRFRD
jgi:hypothetical protein